MSGFNTEQKKQALSGPRFISYPVYIISQSGLAAAAIFIGICDADAIQ